MRSVLRAIDFVPETAGLAPVELEHGRADSIHGKYGLYVRQGNSIHVKAYAPNEKLAVARCVCKEQGLDLVERAFDDGFIPAEKAYVMKWFMVQRAHQDEGLERAMVELVRTALWPQTAKYRTLHVFPTTREIELGALYRVNGYEEQTMARPRELRAVRSDWMVRLLGRCSQ